MIIYLDESYPETNEKVILGALFVGRNEHKRLYSRVREIKRNYKYQGEIKYSDINNKKKLGIAKKMIKAYFNSKNSSFRACILPYSATKLASVTGQDLNQKRVMVYTDSAKKLILGNLPAGTVSDIYLDEEPRIKKTKLQQRLSKARSTAGARISGVYFSKSSDESRCVLQICDLLTGSIKQNLYSTNTKKGSFKKALGEYVMKLSGVPGCGEEHWKKNKCSKNHKKYPKFSISYFELPSSFYLKK